MRKDQWLLLYFFAPAIGLFLAFCVIEAHTEPIRFISYVFGMATAIVMCWQLWLGERDYCPPEFKKHTSPPGPTMKVIIDGEEIPVTMIVTTQA